VNLPSCVWWHTPVISALRRLKQEDCEFDVSLNYIVRPCSQKEKKKAHRNFKLFSKK
jgi:hypothetical protein